MKLLSILICTLESRKIFFDQLMSNLKSQLDTIEDSHLIEVLVDDSSELITTGQKRNNLINQAQGLFVVFIDDDDEVSDDYCESILSCIKNNDDVDCIGISGVISYNGKHHKKWKISKEFDRNVDYYNYLARQTNHISPVRREIAIKVSFPTLTYGEDLVYSTGIQQFLNKEAIIDKELYHYKFREEYNITENITRPPFR